MSQNITPTDLTPQALLELLNTCAGEPLPLGEGEDVFTVPLVDLGYDSLARLELISQLSQRLGVRLADDSIEAEDSIRDVQSSMLSLISEPAAA